MCFKSKKTPAKETGATLVTATPPVATDGEQQLAKTFESLSPELKDKVKEVTQKIAGDPEALKEVFGDVVQKGKDLERELGRKPTFAEFAKATFAGAFGKAMGNKKIVTAAQDETKQIGDGKENT